MRTDSSDCNAVLARLWEYLDGELPPEERATFAAHLRRCVPCGRCGCFERAYLGLLARQRNCPAPRGLIRRLFPQK